MRAGDAKRRADSVVNPRVDRLGRAAGLGVLRRVIRKTPVDTGHAQANWNAKVGGPDERVREDRTMQTAITEGSAKIRVWQMSDGKPLHVTNAVPYIHRLEEGYSIQAPPNYMVGSTVLEMKPVIDRITKELNRG